MLDTSGKWEKTARLGTQLFNTCNDDFGVGAPRHSPHYLIVMHGVKLVTPRPASLDHGAFLTRWTFALRYEMTCYLCIHEELIYDTQKM
jgi:hypothetical protein